MLLSGSAAAEWRDVAPRQKLSAAGSNDLQFPLVSSLLVAPRPPRRSSSVRRGKPGLRALPDLSLQRQRQQRDNDPLSLPPPPLSAVTAVLLRDSGLFLPSCFVLPYPPMSPPPPPVPAPTVVQVSSCQRAALSH